MPENMDAERHKAMFTIGKQSYDNYQTVEKGDMIFDNW